MLKGKAITLRPIQEDDLPHLYEHILEVENRGEFYPASIQTLAELRKELNSSGFWTPEFGILLLIDNEGGKVIGQIVFFKTVQYMTELEIGYIMYDTSARARGGMTEAVKLLTRYLFETKQFNRIRLCIATENGPSRRVAEKSGYKHEGTQRGAWWNRGRFYDMELYAVTREDASS
ncbi:MAG: GNAT family protein [Dehalococcoidia bacterium]